MPIKTFQTSSKLFHLIMLFILSSGTVIAQDTSGLKKYDWYLDHELITDEKHQQILREKYPDEISEEIFEGKGIGLNVYRLIYNSTVQFVILEKREWEWGGVFYYENGKKLTLMEYGIQHKKLTNPEYKQ